MRTTTIFTRFNGSVAASMRSCISGYSASTTASASLISAVTRSASVGRFEPTQRSRTSSKVAQVMFAFQKFWGARGQPKPPPSGESVIRLKHTLQRQVREQPWCRKRLVHEQCQRTCPVRVGSQPCQSVTRMPLRLRGSQLQLAW